MMPTKTFKRIIQFHPGHNCIDYLCKWDHEKCKPGEGGSHGIYGMEIVFALKRERVVIEFRVLLGYMIPGRCEHGGFPNQGRSESVTAFGLTYHSDKPQYTDHMISGGECPWMPKGVPCYTGTKFSEHVALEILAEHGDEELWKYLEGVYESWFNDQPWPVPPPTKLVPR